MKVAMTRMLLDVDDVEAYKLIILTGCNVGACVCGIIAMTSW